MSNGLVSVQFIRSYGTYGEGEIAGFSEAHVAFLIKKGIARKVEMKTKQTTPSGGQQQQPDPAAGPQHRQTTGTTSKPGSNNK
jgi:hypothetical protein